MNRYQPSPQFKHNMSMLEAKLDIMYYYNDAKYYIYREVLKELGFTVSKHFEGALTYHKLKYTKPIFIDPKKRIIDQEPLEDI